MTGLDETGASGLVAAGAPAGDQPVVAAPAAPAASSSLDRDQLVLWLLLALWVLNVADLLLTRYALWLGFASESNGVMAFFLRQGTLPATAFKLGVVSVGVLVLWRVRYRPVVPVVAALLAAFFAAVVAYQVAWVLSL